MKPSLESHYYYPLIEVDELKKLVLSEEVILIDASASPTAKSDFEQEHLENAQFIDLETELSPIDKNPENGGRHPLPTVTDFCIVLQTKGISNNSHVVIYDHFGGGLAASRFWWMLKAIGHQKVQVLNGGFQEAIRLNYPVFNTSSKVNTNAKYQAKSWIWPIATMDEVTAASVSQSCPIVDVRDQNRFEGKVEPIDPIAGHIPSAINIPFKLNLDDNFRFLPKEQLFARYEKLQGESIFHCGSGVTACHGILAMYILDLPIPTLYIGSWSEWCRSENPMITSDL